MHPRSRNWLADGAYRDADQFACLRPLNRCQLSSKLVKTSLVGSGPRGDMRHEAPPALAGSVTAPIPVNPRPVPTFTASPGRSWTSLTAAAPRERRPFSCGRRKLAALSREAIPRLIKGGEGRSDSRRQKRRATLTAEQRAWRVSMRPGVEVQGGATIHLRRRGNVAIVSPYTLCHMRVESKASARCAWVAPPRSPPTILVSGSYVARKQQIMARTRTGAMAAFLERRIVVTADAQPSGRPPSRASCCGIVSR